MSQCRRTFLKTSAAALTALSMPALSYAQVNGSNSKLRIAVVGFRGRGREQIAAIKEVPGLELVALCDADQDVLNKHETENKNLIRTQDFRELLDRNDIDAIASATPNHWHALITMLALQAGKHVYIEKPISHNMAEGQAIVRAASKYNKIVQCGFQNRSDSSCLPFFEGLQAGEYGQVQHVHGTCHRERDSIGKLDSPLTIPSSLNYDLWLGPADDQPLFRPQLHYDWHWDFNTGNGDVGNQGPHEWDLLNWALNDSPNLPTKMRAAGNRFCWNDAGNTPNVLACYGESNGIPFCFEVMDLKGGRQAPHGCGVGVIVTTDEGTFIGGRSTGRFEFADGTTRQFKQQQGENSTALHLQNFVDAIQANNRKLLRSDCAVAANSASMAHMANISFQLAEEAAATEIERAYCGSVVQRDMLARLRESTLMFAAANGIGAPAESWLLGPELSFDGASFQFQGETAAAANAKMDRAYRKGFELPKL